MENVAFSGVSDPTGLEIRDRVSRCQFTFATPTRPDPSPADADGFPFPVERACRITTDQLELAHQPSVIVRDQSGDLVAGMHDRDHQRFPARDYFIEVSAAVKTYLRVSGPMEIRAPTDSVAVAFDEPVDVTVAARAYLKRPTSTVTTTTALDDVRRAVETQSASLRTMSPERSFPTLRGHPPRIRLGDELAIPDGAVPPETAIEVVVRPRLADVFAVAPLVHYLGASLSFGETPRIVAGETSRPLAAGSFGADSFEHAVERALKHVLVLDCFVRKAGSYPIGVSDLEPLARSLSLDVETLFEAAPAERLAEYLSVSTEQTVPCAPRWPSVAYVDPSVDAVELLPYLVNDLTLVRTEEVERYTGDDARRAALNRFVGGNGTVDHGEAVRGASAVFSGGETFVDVPKTAARHQLWVGDGIPLNANEPMAAGYEHRHRRKPTEDRPIRVLIVCNDPEMAAEAVAVEGRYASESGPSFDVETHRDATTDQLRTLFEQDAEFLHYVGHATADGLGCSDGWLDVSTVDSVGADVFFLNACQSYEQGRALVEAGAVGGVVTLGDVNDDAAVETGTLVARLLDRGFALDDALSVAGRSSVVAGQYLAIGDSGTTVARPDKSVANVCHVETDGDDYRLWNTQFLSRRLGVGATGRLHIPEWTDIHLCGSEVGPITLGDEEFRDFCSLQDVPVWVDGDLRWSGELARDGRSD